MTEMLPESPMSIRVDAVSFAYPGGVVALREVSLAIGHGEAVAILGGNGAGKTTLVKHFNGLLRPDQGAVTVGGWDTREHPVGKLAARVGYVFQNSDDQLFERTVLAEVMFGPRNLGKSPADAARAAGEALEKVGLARHIDRHPYDLHLSQRKLLALAAVLATDTPILVLDEPTTGQDAAGLRRIAAIIAALRAENRTVITISHDIDFCVEHFDRCVLMAGGRVLLDGPMRQVMGNAALLPAAGVEQPQMVRLASALGLPGMPLSVPAFVEALAARGEASGDNAKKEGDHGSS